MVHEVREFQREIAQLLGWLSEPFGTRTKAGKEWIAIPLRLGARRAARPLP